MVDRLSVDNTLDRYLAHINNNNYNSIKDESNSSNSIPDNSNNNIYDNNIHDNQNSCNNNDNNNNIHSNINNNNNSSIHFISREELGRFIILLKDETEYLDFLQLSLADWLEQGVCMYMCTYTCVICTVYCIVLCMYMLEQGVYTCVYMLYKCII